MSKENIAFVVVRYGLNINGGAEYHCRMLAERLTNDYNVEVLTTCVDNYRTGENIEFKEKEIINKVTVRRFKTNPTHPELENFYKKKAKPAYKLRRFLYKCHFQDLKFDFIIRKQLFKPMLFFSGWNGLGSFAYMIKSQGLNMLLNVFFGPIVNAARGVSNMVMSAIQGFQSNIVIAFRPQLIQSYATGDNERVLKLFYSLSKVSFILLAMLSIPVIIEIEYILHLWLGDTIPDYTIPFTILVLVNMIISSLNTPVSQVVHATGKMKNYQIGTCLMVCAILPVSWVFLKLGFDPVVVYWVSLIITIVNQLVCNLLLKKVYPYSLKEYCRKVIIPCVAFVILVPLLPFAITMIFPISFLRLLLTGAMSVLISITVSYILVLDKSERTMFLNFIKRKNDKQIID